MTGGQVLDLGERRTVHRCGGVDIDHGATRVGVSDCATIIPDAAA